MKLYFSGTPEEFKEIAQCDDGVQADDYGDGTQLPTLDGGIILCGTVCEADSKSFKLRLSSSADVVQISSEILILDYRLFSVGDFVQVKVHFKPVQTANDTFLYRLIAGEVIERMFRRN